MRIAPEKAGAVSLVTAFQQPDAKRRRCAWSCGARAGLEPDGAPRGRRCSSIDFAKAQRRRGRCCPDAGAAAPARRRRRDARRRARRPPSAARGSPRRHRRGRPAIEHARRRAACSTARSTPAAASRSTSRRSRSRDVLRLIAEVSDLNIIAGDEVKGKVTIRLVDVPWDQALDVILLTKGLGFVARGQRAPHRARPTCSRPRKRRGSRSGARRRSSRTSSSSSSR